MIEVGEKKSNIDFALRQYVVHDVWIRRWSVAAPFSDSVYIRISRESDAHVLTNVSLLCCCEMRTQTRSFHSLSLFLETSLWYWRMWTQIYDANFSFFVFRVESSDLHFLTPHFLAAQSIWMMTMTMTMTMKLNDANCTVPLIWCDRCSIDWKIEIPCNSTFRL